MLQLSLGKGVKNYDLPSYRTSRHHNPFKCIRWAVKDHLEDIPMQSDGRTIIDGSAKLTVVMINMVQSLPKAVITTWPCTCQLTVRIYAA